MSWSDIFPILTDEHVDDFKAEATAEEVAELAEWFEVARIIPPVGGFASGRHIVSATLFWKNLEPDDPDLPPPSRYRILHARRLGLVKRLDPWGAYVEPYLLYSSQVKEKYPDAILRVYLASDLEFLVEDLTAAGWEVHLMKSPSIRFCPGCLWRFLALEEEGKLITMIDSDRVREVNLELERTRLMDDSGLGLWRVPGYYNDEVPREVPYRPLLAGHFAARGGVPVRDLVKAYVWHLIRGSLPTSVMAPGCGPTPMRYLRWPGYGVDEVFLLMALYPRLIEHGTLTFVPTDARSQWLPLDIEYCTWANAASEVIYVPMTGCCGPRVVRPAAAAAEKAPGPQAELAVAAG